MKHSLAIAALVAGLAGTPGLAQDAPAEQPAYDAQPFLTAMLRLRGTALECDSFVQGGPAQRTASIDDFVAALKMDKPDLVNQTTVNSLNKFVRSQAASLCQERLETAYDDYEAAARAYLASKPEKWPNPPAVSKTDWCAMDNCLDLK